MKRTKKLSGAGLRFLKNSRHNTGVSITASTKAPARRRRRSGPWDRTAPLRPLHREQRNERADHDQPREQQRPVDLPRCAKDAVLQRQPGVLAAGQVAVDVLGHDHRGVDDDAEIDRADREQVRRLAAEEEHREGEQQRQGDIDGHDQRRPHVAEEHQQDRSPPARCPSPGSPSRCRS